MGTRNLVAVFVDDKPVIAQYGQWDGYPEGQGRTVLDFCRKRLKTPLGREKFSAKLSQVRWDREGEMEAFGQEIGVTNGWLNSEQAEKYNQRFPYMSRDIGGKILGMVWDADGEVVLNDSSSFAASSLFCEFAYVVDLTKNTLEAYKGFQTTPPPEGERFAHLPVVEEGYYPVKLAGSWSLDKPPFFRTFAATIKKSRA
jgi:hypothetical protein